jgi:hypothetical protein
MIPALEMERHPGALHTAEAALHGCTCVPRSLKEDASQVSPR